MTLPVLPVSELERLAAEARAEAVAAARIPAWAWAGLAVYFALAAALGVML